MAQTEIEPCPTFDQMSQHQLEIYALELHQHMLEERRLRISLEQRVHELAAVNQIFREALEERFSLVSSFERIEAQLRQLTSEAEAVVQSVGNKKLFAKSYFGPNALP